LPHVLNALVAFVAEHQRCGAADGGDYMRRSATLYAPLVLIASLLAGCAHYPPPLSPGRGQSAAQQDTDARECDRQVHSGASTFVSGVFTAWSEKERDGYVTCMQSRGYTVSK
jgi:hypothetical protein